MKQALRRELAPEETLNRSLRISRLSLSYRHVIRAQHTLPPGSLFGQPSVVGQVAVIRGIGDDAPVREREELEL